VASSEVYTFIYHDYLQKWQETYTLWFSAACSDTMKQTPFFNIILS